MLYLIYGTDTHKSRKKLHELLEQAKKRRPNAELFKINNENWNSAKFEELLVSQGLFEQKYTVVLDNLFEKKDSKDFILDKIKEMAESEQVFLMLEGAVDSTNLKKIKKYAKQVQEFKKAEKVKSESNIFSITALLIPLPESRMLIKKLSPETQVLTHISPSPSIACAALDIRFIKTWFIWLAKQTTFAGD